MRGLALLPLVICVTAPAMAGESSGFGPEGLELAPVLAGSAARVAEEWVLGPQGGVAVTELQARLALDSVAVELALPAASYATPGERALSLGNVQTTAWIRLPDSPGMQATLGLHLAANLGAPAWTWAQSPLQLWPATSLGLRWQAVHGAAPLRLLSGASANLIWPQEIAPYPGSALRLGALLGADWSIDEHVGLVAESGVSYWDVSPWRASALLRVDAMGARLRGGLRLPLASWLGWTPAELQGPRELSLVLDLGVAL